jgi:hypothetical protein
MAGSSQEEIITEKESERKVVGASQDKGESGKAKKPNRKSYWIEDPDW